MKKKILGVGNTDNDSLSCLPVDWSRKIALAFTENPTTLIIVDWIQKIIFALATDSDSSSCPPVDQGRQILLFRKDSSTAIIVY